MTSNSFAEEMPPGMLVPLAPAALNSSAGPDGSVRLIVAGASAFGLVLLSQATCESSYDWFDRAEVIAIPILVIMPGVSSLCFTCLPGHGP